MTATETRFSLTAAEDFVFAHGVGWPRSYWKAACGCRPSEVFIFDVEPWHDQESGGWRSPMGPADAPVSLAGTLDALRLIAAINLGEDIFEIWSRTAAYLLARRDDQGWDEPGAPWPGQGDGPGRRAWYTTAISSYMRAVGGDEVQAAIEKAWALPAIPTAWPTHFQAVQVSLGWDAPVATARANARAAHDALQGVVAGSPAPATWAFVHEQLRLGGVPHADPLRRALWHAMAEAQLDDGGWASDSREERILATLFVARELVAG